MLRNFNQNVNFYSGGLEKFEKKIEVFSIVSILLKKKNIIQKTTKSLFRVFNIFSCNRFFKSYMTPRYHLVVTIFKAYLTYLLLIVCLFNDSFILNYFIRGVDKKKCDSYFLVDLKYLPGKKLLPVHFAHIRFPGVIFCISSSKAFNLLSIFSSSYF